MAHFSLVGSHSYMLQCVEGIEFIVKVMYDGRCSRVKGTITRWLNAFRRFANDESLFQQHIEAEMGTAYCLLH